MKSVIVLAAVAWSLAVIATVICVAAAESIDRAVEPPAVDPLDEPIPYLPVEVPPTVQDVAWLRSIGVQP